MNIKIQKLIAYNETIQAYFMDTSKPSAEAIDAVVYSEKILQEISKEALTIKTEIDKKNLTIEGNTEIKKLMSKLLFDKQDSDSNNLLVQYRLANGYKSLKKDNEVLKLENVQLQAEIELIKQDQIKKFK